VITIPHKGQIRDLLHTVTVGNLTPAQIEASGEGVFLSKDALASAKQSIEIVQHWQKIHAPAYGAPIPNTSVVSVVTGDSGILPVGGVIPGANKTYLCTGADMLNNGTGTLSASLGLSDGVNFVTLAKISSLGAGGQGAFDMPANVYFDSSVYLAFLITSGTAAEAGLQAAYTEVVQ